MDLLRQASEAAAAKRLARLAELSKKSLKPLPTWDAGYDSSGRRLVQTLGQDPVAVGRPVSNGAIGTGDRTYNTGRAVDVIPHIKPVPVVPVKIQEPGGVRILFSVVEGDRLVFYVGGDRRTPKELFSVPFDDDPDANLVSTGKGLNQFYWQSRTVYRDGGLLAGVRISGSRLPSSIDFPTIPLGSTLIPGYGPLVTAIPQFPDDTYLARHYGVGVFAAGYVTPTVLSTGVSSSLQLNYSILRGDSFESGSMAAGVGTRTPNLGVEGGGFHEGNIAYSSSIDGVPYLGGSGTESGLINMFNRSVTYSANYSKYRLLQLGSGASLIRRDYYNYPAGGASSSQFDYAGFVDGSYFPLGDEAKSLITSRWQYLHGPKAPNYSSIVKGALWVRDEPSLVYISETQDFVDFKSISLTTGAISAKRVKIFPVVKSVYKIHSVTYTP